MPIKRRPRTGQKWKSATQSAGITLRFLGGARGSDGKHATQAEYGRMLGKALGVSPYTDSEVSLFMSGQRDFPAAIMVAAFNLAGFPLDEMARRAQVKE